MPSVLSSHIYADENTIVQELLNALDWNDARAQRVHSRAVELVDNIRARKTPVGQLESFLQQYALDTQEGLALMSLAEALLRISDSATANDLIEDKISAANWLAGAAQSKDWLTKAAGFGLSLTQKTLKTKGLSSVGKPIIREATVQAIRILGRQFVLGQTMAEALKRGKDHAKQGYRFSYDMLGEGARTMEDAARYFTAYADAIDFIGQNKPKKETRASGISVKLSALYPRYEYSHRHLCVPSLSEKLNALAEKAASYNIALTVDAEEVDRLEISLDIIKSVFENPALEGWDGYGMAIQSYQKRCMPLIKYLADSARAAGRKMRVRLVKGAYWDTEIKRAQVMGLHDYPLFTRKASTDVSYIACAQELLNHQDVIFPMFATHNAHTVMAILDLVGNDKAYELQRLHGMGEGLFDVLKAMHKDKNIPVTIYAPVGSHSDLLPYLVRRLLENGANSSFVNKLLDPDIPAASIVSDPVAYVRGLDDARHPKIEMPCDLFEKEAPYGRKNSRGFDITDPVQVDPVLSAAARRAAKPEKIGSLIGGKIHLDGDTINNTNPENTDDIVAHVAQADAALTTAAFEVAHNAFEAWNAVDASDRAIVLERFADLLEAQEKDFIALLVREAGKTISDAHDEVREAVDFARYYANRGRFDFAADGQDLPGPTGESNRLYMHGRGVFACIAPWNFPLAIFAGQVLAALMAGNTVVAKPAELTPLVALKCVQLMHEAGVPKEAVNLITARGSTLGKILGETPHLGGVAFTGSTAVAQIINQTLAARENSPIIPLIAETGGMNAMIMDSSALCEQVVDDVILSAFGSAGQRCSALRVLCVQDEIADKLIQMLTGAMQEIIMGQGGDLATDVGPVIDDKAYASLSAHIDDMAQNHRVLHRVDMPDALVGSGHFLEPIAIEMDNINDLKSEQFGPILHVVRYKKANIEQVFDDINASGYGLTFGVHSRLESFQKHAAKRIKAGNIYVNRSMTGAVVGVQPFGGQGLSGTGPKAGGPQYLHAFATEKTISIDTTAAGGNTSLVCLEE